MFPTAQTSVAECFLPLFDLVAEGCHLLPPGLTLSQSRIPVLPRCPALLPPPSSPPLSVYPFSTFLVCIASPPPPPPVPPPPPLCNQPLSVTAGLFVYQLQGPVSAKNEGDKRGCSHVVVLFLSSSPLSLSALLCSRVHPLFFRNCVPSPRLPMCALVHALSVFCLCSLVQLASSRLGTAENRSGTEPGTWSSGQQAWRERKRVTGMCCVHDSQTHAGV